MKEKIEKTVQSTDELMEQNKGKVFLGFRTNKTWKKVISISYLIFCVAFALFTIIGERKGQVTAYDYLIDKASCCVLAFASFCPYIFLSNTKLRDKLPLLKKHSIGASIGGSLIVFAALFMVFGVVDSAHSSEYKADMKNHAYDVVSSRDATCEADGEVIYYCEYCGKESTEIIDKLGHNMAEVTRKEATESAEGQIINKCSVCGKKETITLEKLTKEENTTKSNKTTNTPANEENKESSTKITEKQTEVMTEKTTEKTTEEITTKATNTSTESMTKFKWKSAIGNLYNGVELYIVTEDKSILYGVVTAYDTSAHQVQVYLVAGENFMWFPTRETSFLDKLKVRSDDPHLPENR